MVEIMLVGRYGVWSWTRCGGWSWQWLVVVGCHGGWSERWLVLAVVGSNWLVIAVFGHSSGWRWETGDDWK